MVTYLKRVVVITEVLKKNTEAVDKALRKTQLELHAAVNKPLLLLNWPMNNTVQIGEPFAFHW